MTIIEQAVLRLISTQFVGRDNAVTGHDLALSVGMECAAHLTDRDIRGSVNVLRKEGHPIASTTHHPCGYFFPATESEGREAMKHIFSRVKEMYAIAAGVNRGLCEMFGQQMGFGFLALPETHDENGNLKLTIS